MKVRSGIRLGMVVAVVAGSLALWGSPGGAAPPEGRGAGNVHATLIRVHAFDVAKGGGKGGPPAPSAANCSSDGATSAGDSALTGWKSAGGVARLNVSTVPTTIGSPVPVIQGAFDAWSGAPGFTVLGDGTASKQTANRQTDVLFGRVSGRSIAVTYTWRWSDGLIESDTVFNQSLPWADLTADDDGCNEGDAVYDLANIAVHEFGHIYGLDHPGGGRFESMYRYGYTGETLKRTPGAGDLAGIAALYF